MIRMNAPPSTCGEGHPLSQAPDVQDLGEAFSLDGTEGLRGQDEAKAQDSLRPLLYGTRLIPAEQTGLPGGDRVPGSRDRRLPRLWRPPPDVVSARAGLPGATEGILGSRQDT